MSKTVVDCYLSQKSFEDAAKEIRKYTENFKKKCEEFGLQLALNGYSVTKVVVNSIPISDKGNISVDLIQNRSNGNFDGVISISGEQCVFIEFGSGVKNNTVSGNSTHPQGERLGLTIDSYNPNGEANIKGWDGSNATNPKGWFTPEGEHTYGTPAYMPLEKGNISMINSVEKIARKVFG